MKARQLRAKAKESLRGKYWWAILASIITWVFGAISFAATGSGALAGGTASGAAAGGAASSTDTEVLSESLENLINSIPAPVMEIIGKIVLLFAVAFAMSLILGFIISILGCAVKLGYALFNIDLYTGKKPSLDILFSRMPIVGKAFWLQILIGIKVFLWTLLFIIPGIIAAYRYSMAEYILAENPEIKAREAIKRSCKLMKGNKWKYFCLDLSFIGWDILAAIVPFGEFFLNPYKQAAYAAFYIDKSGRFVVINDVPQSVSAEEE